MRARAEVAHWLKMHGGEYHDPQGLITGRMKADLGKGRALSQLLADMERDKMIKREIHGRRTLSIKLLDDWGLADDLSAQPVFRPPVAKPQADGNGNGEALSLENVDLEALAETLLIKVVRNAQTQPSKGAELERLREKVATLTHDLSECRDSLILARESEAEHRRDADKMRKSLANFEKEAHRRQKDGIPLIEKLDDKSLKALDRMMREIPTGR